MVEKTKLYEAIKLRNKELRGFPVCACRDSMQSELNALIMFARSNYEDYDDAAPSFNRFSSKRDAIKDAGCEGYIKRLVDETMKKKGE